MNFPPFNGHFPTVHQFAAAKFANTQIQPGAMIVTSASDGTIQYIRPEHNGTTFMTSSSSNSPVQAIPVAVNIPVPPDSRANGMDQETLNSQSVQQQQLTSMMGTPVNKYPHPPGALLGWGDIPMMHHFNDTSKNITTINVPTYPPPQSVNSGAFLSMQPPPTSAASAAVWPVKLMQSVATMTGEDSEAQPQDLCKVEGDKNRDASSEAVKETELKTEQKDSCDSEEDSEDSNKCEGNRAAQGSSEVPRSEGASVSVPTSTVSNGTAECSQIQLQQQGSAMADYLARLPASTIPLSLQHFLKYQTEGVPGIKREGEPSVPPGVFLGGAAITPVNNIPPGVVNIKKKKKKKSHERSSRPKPGEIRLSTALDGSTLFCCPECHMAYPDRELLEQHMGGHKLERRFVCNICGAGLKRKEHLDQHKKGHSDERPFVCSVCLKGFKRNEHLTRHFVIHSGEKTHACWECGKKFSRKDHLHKHTQTHMAKRVKTEMTQDNVPGGVSASGGSGSVPHPPLGAVPPPTPVHTVIPNVPHPLQLHHAMSSA